MSPPFRVVPLDPDAPREDFRCGVQALDRYFHTQAGQDIRRRVAACFTALDAQGRVAGYYTLASASIDLSDLPEKTARKLPRYPRVPAVLMGRLAVDVSFRDTGLGAALLADALRRAARAEVMAFALLVDAKDETAAAFYAHHGFIAAPGKPLLLFLPLASVKDLAA